MDVAVHPFPSVRAVDGTRAATVVRRFGGPLADELFLLCRPDDPSADPGRQADAVYAAMREALAAAGAGPAAVVSETVFLGRVRDDAVVAAARDRALGSAAGGPARTVIGQAPLGPEVDLEVAAVALLPRPGIAFASHEVTRPAACACEACARGVRARVVRLGDATFAWAGNVYGTGGDAYEAASAMFRAADELLAEAGLTFRDVVRTWIHLRDIDRDYDALNAARRDFFRRRGVERRPASTGVQGIPCPGAHDVSMSVYATRAARPLDVAVMSAPSSLNEAWTYGADFSRGLRVADANKVGLLVSGTASVDADGRTAHPGDFGAQVDRMLHNLESLLARQGATVADVVSGVTYLTRRTDAAALRAAFAEHGFGDVPCAVVDAPLCRRDLLCETEVVAILPPAARGA